MDVTLTPAAINHLTTCIEGRGTHTEGIRLGVKASGCSGFAYVVEFANDKEESDNVTTIGDLKIFIDPKSMVHLKGMEIDFVTEGLQKGLKFNNPNVKSACGCGESFTT